MAGFNPFNGNISYQFIEGSSTYETNFAYQSVTAFAVIELSGERYPFVYDTISGFSCQYLTLPENSNFALHMVDITQNDNYVYNNFVHTARFLAENGEITEVSSDGINTTISIAENPE